MDFLKNENTYIMNLEACYIYKDKLTGVKTTSKGRDLKKLFSATIPYSLETIRMNEMFKDSIKDLFYEVKGKQYTRCIINITFDKNYFVWVEEEGKGIKKIIADKKKIRKDLYKNGFELDGVKYVFYKRGAGKAKNGFAFFVREDMKEQLILRSRLGLIFEENEDLDFTSLLAYESLVSSGIDFTIDLDPKTEVLLISDIYGKEFTSLASVTKEEGGVLVTKNETINIKNCLTDGQGLMDESIFEKYNKQDKGFMLLRSDMFKCCAFNTKLQEWFKQKGVTTVKDMFGNEYDASKIKLVTTPNSLKFLKFAYKIGDGSKKNCFDYWKNHIDTIFGIVKCDKEGNYGTYNRTTYQLLNSIPSLTYEELMEITKLEREYVMLLKNDEAVFRNYLGKDALASLRLEKILDADEELSALENTELYSALILVNSDIQYTTKFKTMKKNLIGNYISNLRVGKIRLKDTKYCTLVSNPYEMLLSITGEYDGCSIMEGREVYCPYYEEGQEFCISRNPHINAGNVMYGFNKRHDEYKWFNFTDNIVAVNFYDNDMPDRLQGCDTDSDTFIMIPNAILVEKAKYCEATFATPINKVKGSALPRKNNMQELQKLDVILSDNYIGKIVNLSQIINSYLNQAIFDNQPEEVIDTLYQASSRLSSMSQIEIDKSKKVFDNVNMSKEIKRIKKITYIKYEESVDKYGNKCKKMVVPKFFEMISSEKDYRVFKKFNTPLDILQDVLEFKHSTYRKGVKHKEMCELLVKPKQVEGRYRKVSAEAIYKIINECGRKVNGLKVPECNLNPKAKNTIEKKYKMEAESKLKALDPSEATILGVLNQCFGDKSKDKFGFKKYASLTLNLLFVTHKKSTLKCFRSKQMDLDEVLIKIKDEYDFDLFGKKYQKMTRKDINL